jgi:hypothetical protein
VQELTRRLKRPRDYLGESRFRQRDANNLEFGRQFPLLALAIFQAKLDRFANILKRLVASPSLADTPRDNRTLGNQETVFARRQDYR